jgi:O-methyltransferase
VEKDDMEESANLGKAGKIQRTDTTLLYLDMVKRSLTDSIYWDDPLAIYTFCRLDGSMASWKRYGVEILQKLLDRYKIRLVKPYFVDWLGDYSQLSKDELANRRLLGNYWPVRAHTMIGLKRLDNIQFCVEMAIKDKIPGDLIETGVWRGGACIFMRAILEAYGDTTRTVWVADSFVGLPPPNAAAYHADAGDTHHTYSDFLAVSRREVEENFRRYNLLDGQVRFLEGWFKDTLPKAPIDRLAVLRLDGDMYESTIQTLEALYDKLSCGGFAIVDDYHLEPCKQAVTDFRSGKGINDTIIDIDGNGVFWRKSSHGM